jgi:lipopolysaccharide export system permease protein
MFLIEQYYKPFQFVATGQSSLIIYRYLSREIFFSTFAVALVLVPIIVSGRLINTLTRTNPGEMSLGFIFELIIYRLPSMLMLILPLALFLGVLLAYGKLYLESEMSVLKASGISGKQLVTFALGPALGGALIIASFSLYISPLAFEALEVSYAKRAALSELDTLTAGRFEKLPGDRTVYTSEFLDDRSKMDKVFVAQLDKKTSKLEITYAKSGSQLINKEGKRYLVLKDGYRYTGIPGFADYEQLKYHEYGYLLPERQLKINTDEPSAKMTMSLIGSDKAKDIAELQWRFALPLLAFIVVLIAVPLSRTNPRQGRYAQLIPTIFLYLVYLSILMSARDKVEDGASVYYIWLVHLVFLIYGLSLIFFEQFWTNLWNKIPSVKSLIKGRAATKDTN